MFRAVRGTDKLKGGSYC